MEFDPVRKYSNIEYMGIFDELYPGVLKSKVYDGHFFEMGTLGEPFRATEYVVRMSECKIIFLGMGSEVALKFSSLLRTEFSDFQ